MSSIAGMTRLIAIFATIATESIASPLFESHGILEVELSGPISSLIENRKTRDEFDFDITAGNEPISLRVRARGNSRLRVCSFPPLRFDFPPGRTERTVFEGQNRLKLVTHCSTRGRDSGNVFDEYLAYRIFNLVSERSFRVRLLRLTYVDTDGRLDDRSRERYGFLIESADEFERRTGARAVRIEGLVYSRLDHSQAALVYVFQYLIGNTDWSLVTALTDEFCCHNGELFDIAGKYVLVPYDFDLAGLVDASYARPDGSLPIRSVRTRVYRGYCTSREELTAALRRIKKLESDILKAAEEVPVARPGDMTGRIRYLDDFFGGAAAEERLLESFERRCL